MAMSFDRVLNYMHEISFNGELLEIGADRGDGSTFLFASIAKNLNSKLYSVDVDPDVISKNKERIEKLPFEMPVEFFLQKGEEFLEQNTDKKFSIVLLDNFDWQWDPNVTEDFIENQKTRYTNEFNMEMTNLNSQITHLRQAVLLTSLLTDQAIVVCDDTYWDHAHATYTGKCGSAIPYLMTIGFIPVLEENHGVILLRK